MTVRAVMTVWEAETAKICFDLIAHSSREEVVDLRTPLPILHSEELCNPKYLHLIGVDPSTFFMEPNVHDSHTPGKDPLHSLYSISIIRPALSGGDLSPFIDFLSHRAVVVNRITSLRIDDFSNMDADTVESIPYMVEVFGEVENYGYDYVCY